MKKIFLILPIILFSACSIFPSEPQDPNDVFVYEAEQLKRSNAIFNAGQKEGYQACVDQFKVAIDDCQPITQDGRKIEGCEEPFAGASI